MAKHCVFAQLVHGGPGFRTSHVERIFVSTGPSHNNKTPGFWIKPLNGRIWIEGDHVDAGDHIGDVEVPDEIFELARKIRADQERLNEYARELEKRIVAMPAYYRKAAAA